MKKTFVILFSICALFSSAYAFNSPMKPKSNNSEIPSSGGDKLWQEVLKNYEKSLQYWPTNGSHATLSLDANDKVASKAVIEGVMLYKDKKHCYLVPSRVTQKGQTKETPEFKDLQASQVKKWQKNVHGHATGFLKALDKNNQANITVGVPTNEGDFSVYLVEQTNEKGKKVKVKYYVDPAKKAIVKVVSFGTATLGDAGSNYTFEVNEAGISILKKIEVLITIKFGDKKTSVKQIYDYSNFVDKSEVRK